MSCWIGMDAPGLPSTRLARAVCAVVLLLAMAFEPARAAAYDVLPDLDQMVPGDLVVKKKLVGGSPTFRLGFASAASNVGEGPLTLHGYRATRSTATMNVDQLVDQSAGPSRLVRDVGRMSYIVHPDHRHWHLLGFERYEIRSGDGSYSLGSDRKTGFCLGDRFAIPDAESLPGFIPTPLQGDTCGLGQPRLTSLFAGISVGWADQYAANLEGQYIDITGVSSGTYILVHRLNLDGRIVESDYTNNASSVRFRLRWRKNLDRLPRVTVIKRCAGTADCVPEPCNANPGAHRLPCKPKATMGSSPHMRPVLR